MALGGAQQARPHALHSTRTRRRLSAGVAVLLILMALFTRSPLANEPWLVLGGAWIGLLLVVAGIFGRLLSTLFIGGRKNKELVREGPYGITRNPLYFFSFLATLGLGLATANPILLVLLVAAFGLYYPGVLASEEEKLAQKHPEAFRRYREEVPRFWPRIGRGWKEPEWVETSPRFFRMALADASAFVVAYIALRAIAEAHAHGLLPAYTLPL
ncbi:MAG: methyltransferase family protein [Thiohalorhabdus sp.]|uniref:methyltransferase family protein n=1 Tax=Thiohalorhabdus sp. TaxID=3094134 RepID=UPI00397E9C26